MKNRLLYVLLASTCALAGCGTSGQQGAASSAQPAAPASTTAHTAPVTEAVAEPFSAAVLASAAPTGQPCSFDSDPHVTIGKQNQLHGWMLGPLHTPAGKLSFVLVGKSDFAIATSTGVARPDVGAYLGDPALSTAGYALSSTLDAVPPGDYVVKLMATSDNKLYVCNTNKNLHVRN